MRRFASLVLGLVVTVLRAQEGIDDVYEAPEVEPSALERHEAGTHEAGQQYDFVRDEATAAEGSEDTDDQPNIHPMIKQLLGGVPRGARVIQMDDAEGLDVADVLRNFLSRSMNVPSSDSQKKGQQKRRAPSLPSIATDTPVSQVLQQMRESLARAAPKGGRGRRRDDDDDDDDDDGEDDDEDDGARADAFISHLDLRGLDLLERDLRRKLARVGAARHRLLAAARARGREARGRASASSRLRTDGDVEEPAEPEEDAGASAAARPGSALGTLEKALLNMMGRRSLRASGEDEETGTTGAGVQDETDGYGARLAAEARARARAGGDGDDDADGADAGDDGSAAYARSLEDVIQRMFIGQYDDGDVVEMNVRMPGADGEPQQVKVEVKELDAGALGANHPLLEMLAGTERASAQEADDAEEESPARHAHTPQ